MTLKKSLFALSTAAVVAVSGASAAVADENTTGSSNNETTQTQVIDPEFNQDPASEAPAEEEAAQGSTANDFFGWGDDTLGVDKYQDVTKFISNNVDFISTIVYSIGRMVKLFVPFV